MKIKFRAWDKASKKMIYPEPLAPFPEFMSWTGDCYNEGVLQEYQMMLWTGLVDKSGTEVFESDLVEFKYFVGDQAWEEMEAEERIVNEKIVGKTFTGLVTWIDESAGFSIIAENPTKIIFPALYATTGKVIGNIHETQTGP